MARFEINAITVRDEEKPENITHVYGPGFGVKTRQEAVDDIRLGLHTYYTRGPGLLSVETEVEAVPPLNRLLAAIQPSEWGYLRSVPNSFLSDNLLSQPKRPARF